MLGYWIETGFFATRTEFTPGQYTVFCKLCQNEVEEGNEFFIGNDRPAFVFCDYSQTWEKHKSDTGSEHGFWKKVDGDKPPIDVQNPTCKTFIKVFPEDAINFNLEGFPDSFIKKSQRWIRVNLYKTTFQSSPIFAKDTIAKDWDLLNDLLEFAEAARENYSGKRKQQGKPRKEVAQPATVSAKDNSELRIAVYEGVLMTKYADEIDEWDIVSKKKHCGRGWHAIARHEIKKTQKTDWEPNNKVVKNKAREIQRLVEARRARLRGVDAEEDQDDKDVFIPEV